MEAIVGSIPAGVVVIEKENGKIVYVNERAVALYGCDISDFESPSRTTKLIRLLTLDGHIYPPQQLPAKKALLTGRETKDELIIEKPDGSRIVVAISAKPVKNEKGQISAAVAVFEDITERKKSEETLSQYTTNLELIVEHRTSQLTLERKRFFSMLEDLPVMVCLITKDYYISYANRMFRQKFGESRGRRCYEYIGKQKEPCSECQSFMPFKTGKPHQWIVKFPNGTIADAHDFLFTDVDGTQMILEADVDITERVTLEKQLREKERLATIGQTAGMVGHDIRNPLQAILGDLYILKANVENLQEENRQAVIESIEAIGQNVSYISKIVADLQDYAKPLRPEPVKIDNLYSIIKKVLSTINIPNNIKTELHCDETLPGLTVDLTFIKRILVNLTTNAIQAMPNGGKLSVKTFQKGDKLILSVEDTGVGIPEEIKPKLFTPLLTTKSKGQGFGLAVVKRMTDALGGTITFESEANKGTKFVVKLPIEGHVEW